MKKIIVILITAILVTSCEYKGKYKYLIADSEGKVYECNFYNKRSNGCIMFNDKPGKDKTPGKPIIICGNYMIRKIK